MACPAVSDTCIFVRSKSLRILAAFVTVAALGSAGAGPEDEASKLSQTVRTAWAGVDNFHVEFTWKPTVLVDRVLIRKFLGTLYLREDYVKFSFQGNKRYYKKTGPEVVDAIAPGVLPDYEVLHNGSARKKNDTSDIYAKKKIDVEPTIEFAFDGELAQNQTQGTTSTIIRSSTEIQNDRYLNQEYLGFIYRKLPDPFDPKGTRQSERLPDCLELSDFRVTDRTTMVEGNPCIVIEGPSLDLAVDRRLGYAVRQVCRYYSGTKVPSTILTNRSFVEKLKGLYLPTAGTYQRCGPPNAPAAYRGKPLFLYNYDVTKLLVNDVPGDAFKVAVRPGNFVEDKTVNNPYSGTPGVIFRMPADPKRVESVVENAMKAKADAEFNSKLRTTLIIAISILLVIGCIIFIKKFVNNR